MSDKLVIVTFKIPYEDLAKLDRYCHEKSISRSEVIRRAIREYLDRTPKEQKQIRVRFVRLGNGNEDKSHEVIGWVMGK